MARTEIWSWGAVFLLAACGPKEPAAQPQTETAPASAGEPAPAPFERPADVVSIERRMGMNDTV